MPWAAGLAAAILAGFAAAFLLRPTAATVRAVANALSGIAGGDLSARVPVRGPDFLRGLSSAFNATAERLEADVERVSTERGAPLDRARRHGGGRLRDRRDRDDPVRQPRGPRAPRRRARRRGRGEADPPPRPRPPVLEARPRGRRAGRGRTRRRSSGRGRPGASCASARRPCARRGRGAILLVGDVSTIRRLERMRSDFVANVSHELRTPLAAIAGAAETLADGALADPEAGPQFVAVIGRHADRLRALVDDLLTLSRLESSPENIERVLVDFARRRAAGLRRRVGPGARRGALPRRRGGGARARDGRRRGAAPPRRQPRRERGHLHAVGRLGEGLPRGDGRPRGPHRRRQRHRHRRRSTSTASSSASTASTRRGPAARAGPGSASPSSSTR